MALKVAKFRVFYCRLTITAMNHPAWERVEPLFIPFVLKGRNTIDNVAGT